MTTEQRTAQNKESLLTSAEQEICQKIVALDTELAGSRAATLLALNQGLTRAETSRQTGLTLGQIRYLLTRFRKMRLALFSEDILSQVQPSTEEREAETIAEAEATPPAVDEVIDAVEPTIAEAPTPGQPPLPVKKKKKKAKKGKGKKAKIKPDKKGKKKKKKAKDAKTKKQAKKKKKGKSSSKKSK